jgi:hypothetical protein
MGHSCFWHVPQGFAKRSHTYVYRPQLPSLPQGSELDQGGPQAKKLDREHEPHALEAIGTRPALMGLGLG